MRYWTCRKCEKRWPRQKPKCPGCGKARPVRKTNAQKALTEDYSVWVTKYGEACGICGRGPSQRRRLDRDHCHASGKSRGLLCARCNRALPNWVDPVWLRSAADYLERAAA